MSTTGLGRNTPQLAREKAPTRASFRRFLAWDNDN
jgi:hypothetical protein